MKMTIDIEPKPAPRPRFCGRAYMPAEYQRYKAAIGALVKSQCPTLIEDNLKLKMTFRRRFKINSRRFGDLDNLVKGVMDALNGIVFADDAQVTELTASKVQSATAGIDIEVIV